MNETRILVVEDEVIIAMEIKDRLSRLGYTVPAIVPSGEEAIRKVAEVNPDLVTWTSCSKARWTAWRPPRKSVRTSIFR
jgi:AmiR/NasT family two-component response regulator